MQSWSSDKCFVIIRSFDFWRGACESFSQERVWFYYSQCRWSVWASFSAASLTKVRPEWGRLHQCAVSAVFFTLNVSSRIILLLFFIALQLEKVNRRKSDLKPEWCAVLEELAHIFYFMFKSILFLIAELLELKENKYISHRIERNFRFKIFQTCSTNTNVIANVGTFSGS